LLGEVSVMLNATVNPEGSEVTSCVFEYGQTSSYGASLPCSPPPGSGTGAIAVAGSLSGLSPATIYHYRIVASNGGGTTESSDQTFTTGSPVLPEIGQCVQHGAGVYKSSGCTIKATGKRAGDYEWQPWPASKDGFHSTGGTVTLEAARKATIKCTANTLAGEYNRPQTAVLEITPTGCEANGIGGGKCQSQGASTGEIKTVALDGQLGTIETGAKPTIGWELTPTSGTELAVFTCGSTEVSLEGSVIAPVKTVDKMRAAFTLKFMGKKGVQVPERFAGGSKDTLILHTPGGSEAIGLMGTLTMSGEEDIEIKAIA
jgi:hypothetical protein